MKHKLCTYSINNHTIVWKFQQYIQPKEVNGICKRVAYNILIISIDDVDIPGELQYIKKVLIPTTAAIKKALDSIDLNKVLFMAKISSSKD